MKIIRGMLLIFLIMTGISLTGCADSEVGPAIYEFKITKVACPTLVYFGQPLNVDVTFTSNETAENVPVALFLAQHTEIDDADVPFHSIGTYIIPTVSRGEHTYQVRVTVPPNLIAPVPDGFRLTAMIDPACAMSKEREECVSSGDTATDREKACFTDETMATVTVDSGYIDSPDLLVEEVVLSTDVATIFADDPNPDFLTGTVTVQSVGIDTLNIPVRFVLEKDSTEYPVIIWDSDIGGYANDYTIGQLRANASKSIPFSIAIEPAIADLLADGENAMTLKATIDPDNIVTESDIPGLSGGELNNTLSTPITIIKEPFGSKSYPSDGITTGKGLVTKAPGLLFSKSYSQMLGNSTFGARPNFSSGAYLNENGAGANTNGGVDVYIFNRTVTFVWLEASAQAIPYRLSSSSVDLSLEFIGIVLYSFHRNGEYSWDKEWSVYKSKGYTATFWAGPIPLNVSAGAQGTIGFIVSFTVGDDLEATATAFANAGAYASASVGIPGLIEGGVKCNLNVVNNEYTAVVTAGMQLSAGAKQIQGILSEEIMLTLAGPNGSLNIFAKYPYQPMCRWWKIYYPCGWPYIKEVQTPIVSFSSWSKTIPLLDLQQSSPWMNTGL